MPTSTHLNIDGNLSTSDATATTIVSIPISDSSVSMRAEISIIARRASNDDQKCWEQLVLIDKTGGGTPTAVASLSNIVPPVATLGATTWTTGLTFDTNHIFVQVTGQASAIINWFASIWAMYILED